jgi:hypothetical protein
VYGLRALRTWVPAGTPAADANTQDNCHRMVEPIRRPVHSRPPSFGARFLPDQRNVGNLAAWYRASGLRSAERDELELDVIRVPEHHRGVSQGLLLIPDAGVLDAELIEPGRPGRWRSPAPWRPPAGIGVLSSRGYGAAAQQRRSPAGIGSSFDVQDGNGDTYQVTLVKVVDPAQGAGGSYDTPDSGTRFVGAVFRITGVSGSPKGDDADNDAALVGSNGRTYTCDFDGIAGYGDFSDGEIQVAQGGTTTGAVSLQVPDGVRVTDVQWSPGNGFGATVQWAGGS